MGFLKGLLWSLCCIGLGIGLATVEINGQTPWSRGTRAWRHMVHPSSMDRLKDGLGDAVDGAKDSLEGAKDMFNKDARPRERHSPQDREAVNRLIARHGTKSSH